MLNRAAKASLVDKSGGGSVNRVMLLACIWLATLALPVEAGLAPDDPTLARYVSAESRLFIEAADMQVLIHTPAGATLAQALANLAMEAHAATPATQAVQTTQAAVITNWQPVLASAIGLADVQASSLLFDGRLAVVVEDWSNLAESVLIARPRQPAELEAALRSHLVIETAKAPIRRYQLQQKNMILASNGKVAVIGWPGDANSAFERTLRLVQSDHGICLADVSEYQERLAMLSPKASLVVYASTNLRTPTATQPAQEFVPWPPIRAIAIGLTADGEQATVDMNARLEYPFAPQKATLPVDTLSALPQTTLAAWTQSIDVPRQFRFIQRERSQGLVRILLDLAQTGMGPGELEQDLLSKLGTTSIAIVDRVTLPDPKDPQAPMLHLPTLGMIVPVSDAVSVERSLSKVTHNFERFLVPVATQPVPSQPAETATQPAQSQPASMASQPDSSEAEDLHILPMGRLLTAMVPSDIAGAFELCWTVNDGWLILGTHRQTVRQIVRSRREEAEFPATGIMRKAMIDLRSEGGVPDLVMVAQPVRVSRMIDSWMDYLSRYHREMLEDSWWRRFHRQQASKVQLGIVPARVVEGTVEIAQTLPEWPAHQVLKAGDRIAAVDGEELEAAGPLKSLRAKLLARRQVGKVTLRILRQNQPMEVALSFTPERPIEDAFQPISILAQLADLGRSIDCASLAVWRPTADLLSARVELRMAAFEPQTTSAPTQPAAQ